MKTIFILTFVLPIFYQFAYAGEIEFRYEDTVVSNVNIGGKVVQFKDFNVWSRGRIPVEYTQSGIPDINTIYSWKLKVYNTTNQKLRIGVVILLCDEDGFGIIDDNKIVNLKPNQTTTIRPYPPPQVSLKYWNKAKLKKTLVSIYWGDDIKTFYERTRR